MKKQLIVIKTLSCIIIFCFMMCIVNNLLRYLLIDDSSSYTRISMHEMYEQDKNIDILFLGSSHSHRSMNTEITDAIFEANTFGGGTSQQQLDGSYAVLKEVGKHNKLSHVYLEMYYDVTSVDISERDELTQTYIIADYMKPSLNKWSLLANASTPEYYMNGFIPARRNHNQLFEKDYIKHLFEKKQTEAYQNFEYIDVGYERYAGKGYVYHNGVIPENGFLYSAHFTPIQEEPFSNTTIKYLEKIINYCKKNQIQLTLYTTPMPNFRLVDMGNYDTYVSCVNQFAQEHGVAYYDFNLCKEAYLHFDDTDFSDTDHLNGIGAEKFSAFFSEFFTGQINQDAFYHTYEEKLADYGDCIFGLLIIPTSYEKDYHIEAVHTGNAKIYYTVQKTANETDDIVLLQERSDNTDIKLPVDENGTITVTAYLDGSDEVHTVVQNY